MTIKMSGAPSAPFRQTPDYPRNFLNRPACPTRFHPLTDHRDDHPLLRPIRRHQANAPAFKLPRIHSGLDNPIGRKQPDG